MSSSPLPVCHQSILTLQADIQAGDKDLYQSCRHSLAHGVLLLLRYLAPLVPWHAAAAAVDQGQAVAIRPWLQGLLQLLKQAAELVLQPLSKPQESNIGQHPDCLYMPFCATQTHLNMCTPKLLSAFSTRAMMVHHHCRPLLVSLSYCQNVVSVVLRALSPLSVLSRQDQLAYRPGCSCPDLLRLSRSWLVEEKSVHMTENAHE